MAKKATSPRTANAVRRMANPDGTITEWALDNIGTANAFPSATASTMEHNMSETTNGGTEPGRRTRRVRWSDNVDAMTLTMALDGTERATFAFAAIPHPMQQRLGLHGLRQKLMDKNSGKPADEAPQDAQDTYDLLVSGMWNEGRSGEGVERTTDFITAVAEFRGWDLDSTKAKINARMASESPDDKRLLDSWRSATEIVDIMARLQRERLNRRQAAAMENAKTSATALADL